MQTLAAASVPGRGAAGRSIERVEQSGLMQLPV
jgi:hypothetical protein